MTTIDDIGAEIARQVALYTNEVEEKVQKAADDVTKQAVREIKANSPVDSGEYQRGWARKKDGTGFVIYNRTRYQLTHLLEHGHAKPGGRVAGKVHIRPAEERAVREFERLVEQAVKG